MIEPNAAHHAVVMATRGMTGKELAALNLAAVLGKDPRGGFGGEKAVSSGLIEPHEETFSPTVVEGLAMAVALRKGEE